MAGDFRWVAEVLTHMVFTEPGHEAARELLTDTGGSYRLLLRNGVLTCTSAPQVAPADTVVRLPAAALPGLALGGFREDPGAAGVRIEGDASVLPRLLAALDAPDPNFAIVTP